MNKTLKSIGLAGLLGATLIAGGCRDNEPKRAAYSYDDTITPALIVHAGEIAPWYELSDEAKERCKELHLNPSEVVAYGPNLISSVEDLSAISKLVNEHVTPALADEYLRVSKDRNLYAWNILDLKQAGVSIQEYAQVTGNLNPVATARLKSRAKVPFDYVIAMSKVRDFHDKASPEASIEKYFEIGASPEVVLRYGSDVSDYEILNMIQEGMSPEEAHSYGVGDRLTSSWAKQLKSEGISGPEFTKYRQNGLDINDVLKFHSEGISAEKTAAYIELNNKYVGVQIEVRDIYSFEQRKIPFEKIVAEAERVDLETRLRTK